VRVGMEATGHARWFERLLAELGFELWIGHPAEIKTKRVRKQKTDREDPRLMLKLLWENRISRSSNCTIIVQAGQFHSVLSPIPSM
jgi:transposase